jgi:starch synthase
MKVAMVSSECEPFAKTGGLADVVDALARALGELGHDVDVYLPRYRGLEPPGPAERTELAIQVPATHGSSGAAAASDGAVSTSAASGGSGRPSAGTDRPGVTTVGLLTARADGYRLRLVDHSASFDRAGYYGESGSDYPDNGARFALLGRAALEAIRSEGGGVSVLHGHDWQAGPAVLLRDLEFGSDPVLGGMATMVTCHNLAYHGWVPRERAAPLGLPPDVGKADGIDLLREEVARADIVNTVSPTYAEESRTPEFGAGLDDVLRGRGDTYLGILNGIDPRLWNPETDEALVERFSAGDLGGKRACKQDLGTRLGIDLGGRRADGPGVDRDGWGDRGAPLFGLVGRLDPQKGFDLLAGAARAMLEGGARMVILGTGDDRLVQGLRGLAGDWPGRLAILERFDRDEARRIYAGSDLLLMPSRFEPCGQSQMIAMRYGTIPLVRSTGGLADTVIDADDHPGEGDGFVFGPAEASALAAAARRAIDAYREEARWGDLIGRAMRRDFSWTASAPRYLEAYARAVALRAWDDRPARG